jgi:hypothetical protein
MSIRAPLVLCAVCCGLAACGGISLKGGGAARSITEIGLYGDALSARGPDQYCVDGVASQPKRGLAVIAACPAVDADGDWPALVGLITVQAGVAGSGAVAGNIDALQALLSDEAGRAVLSRASDANTVSQVMAQSKAQHVTVSYEDNAPQILSGVTARAWRGFLDMNGRMVTVTVQELKDLPMSDTAGLRLLADAIAAVKAVNAPQ